VITAQPLPERTPQQIDEFIQAFFGRGNAVWPDQDPDSPAGRRLVPLLQVLRDSSEIPVVLPRRRPDNDQQLTAYVIAVNAAHATSVAELLTAFVGPSYSTFDGLPARLDRDDPVEHAVLDFAGPNLTFTLSSPTREAQARSWAALEKLQAIVKQRPVRSWRVPRPIGRLLAEFEVALAAGDNSASAELLEQLAASGGLSATNLAHLRIQRLARLGRDSELLRMPALADVVLADPPAPVKDAVLAAIYARTLEGRVATGDLQAARKNLIEAGALVPALLGSDFSGLSAEALVVLALAAWVRDDISVLQRFAANPPVHAQVAQLAPALAQAITARAMETVPDLETSQDRSTIVPGVRPASWLELTIAIADDPGAVEAILADQPWRGWDPPASEDEAIAGVLERLDDDAAERAWAIVGPFVDADGYQQPAARSARELIHNALANNRFSPGDLAGLNALTEIFLRSAPDAGEYADLLDDLRSECGRWAGPDRATVVLDFVDLLARTASPDHEARLRLALSLLRPLHDHHSRLEPDEARFAAQLSEELSTGLEWPPPDLAVPGNRLADLPSLKVLLYSLDEGVLARANSVLSAIAPSVSVKLNHDHVGTSRLKQHSRSADVIVMATRCATHAATGFIRANAASTALIGEADGSGSASLIRAAVAGLQAAAKAPESPRKKSA
jgi:hypothetical protein